MGSRCDLIAAMARAATARPGPAAVGGVDLGLRVNGVLTTEYQDSTDREGYIALQHQGEAGKVYRFRNVRIIELD